MCVCVCDVREYIALKCECVQDLEPMKPIMVYLLQNLHNEKEGALPIKDI